MEYFPEGSIIPIDIFDIEGTAKIIRTEIKTGSYESRLPTIIKAREKVLTNYNLMTKISQIVEERHNPNTKARRGEYIYGRHIYRQKKPLSALGDILHRYRVNRRL